jgi:hypothetical protein
MGCDDISQLIHPDSAAGAVPAHCTVPFSLDPAARTRG